MVPLVINEEHIAKLPLLYEQAGLQVLSTEVISKQELLTYETTWAGRLASGRERQVWRLRAGRVQSGGT